MQKCRYCGADLPENTRFCGKCGSVQDALATDTAATSSNTPPPQSWAPESGTIPASLPPSSNDPEQGSVPTWSSNVQASATPPPVAENEEERRRGLPPWSPLYDAPLGGDALLGSGQAYTPSPPVVQGTPQIGSVPSVAGTPTPYANAPAGQAAPGPANAPAGQPAPGPANASAGQAAPGPANAPVSHPAPGPANAPVSHPVPEPQPTHYPPEPPGTQEHHPPHRPEGQRTYRTQQTAARATKTAGGSAGKTILLVVTAVVVVGAGTIAAAAHFLAHPQPLISITSSYKVGNTPAGASGTILHLSGQNFASNSPVTFLLDGHAAPGNSGTRSDSNGTFSADVTITDAWSAGTHTLTARDASNDSTQNGVSVTIVQPGQANTPGPNGAPPDDATFRINVTNVANVADPFSSNPVLIITGHPDPEGGTVCSPDASGQSFTFNETTTDGMPFTKTITGACSGTYKAGQISYIETSTSIKISYQSNGVNVNCALSNPTVDLRLTGAYAGNNTFSGKLDSPSFSYTCEPQGYGFMHYGSQGVSWTGTIVNQ